MATTVGRGSVVVINIHNENENENENEQVQRVAFVGVVRPRQEWEGRGKKFLISRNNKHGVSRAGAPRGCHGKQL